MVTTSVASPDRIRRWFFDYFIRRYDIVRARKVLLMGAQGWG